MNIRDLMLGDYVNFLIDIEGGNADYDPKVAQYQPMKIVSLSSWHNNDGEVESAEGVINDIDQVKPISLTPEILENNGFENDFYNDESVADYHFVRLEGYSYREDFILVTWCNGELNVVNDLIGEVEIHCENVHELQHALKLCGINKEIEI